MISNCCCFFIDSSRVDSGGTRGSGNRSAGRTKPSVPDNEDLFSFGGTKDVGR